MDVDAIVSILAAASSLITMVGLCFYRIKLRKLEAGCLKIQTSLSDRINSTISLPPARPDNGIP